jgi:hypothetical protein
LNLTLPLMEDLSLNSLCNRLLIETPLTADAMEENPQLPTNTLRELVV